MRHDTVVVTFVTTVVIIIGSYKEDYSCKKYNPDSCAECTMLNLIRVAINRIKQLQDILI